jgi:hypothetical protein
VDDQLALKESITSNDAKLILKENITTNDAKLLLKESIINNDAKLILKENIIENDAKLLLKANKIYVDDQLALKESITANDAKLLLKENITDNDAKLLLKENITDNDAKLLLKENITGGNTATLTLGTGTVLNLSGTKDIALHSTTTAKSVNAGNLSGALTATASAASLNSIVGGSGNDAITLTTTDAVTVDGGAGTADLITLKADNTNAVFNNFEIAQLASGANAVNASQFSGKAIAVKGVAGSSAETLIFGTASKSIDSATIDLSKLLFDGNVGSISIDGSAVSSAYALGGLFNVTGSSIVDNINFDTNSGPNTFSTGAGSDTISAGSGADIINGGADNDLIYADNAGNNRVETFTAGTNGTGTISAVILGETISAPASATDADTSLAALNTAIQSSANYGKLFTSAITVVAAGTANDILTLTYLVDGNYNATAGFSATGVINGGTAATQTAATQVTAGTAGATANNVLTGGTGTDTFVFGHASTTPSDSIFSTITDFATASDIIDYVLPLTIVTNPTAVSGTAAISSAGIATFNSADSTLALRIVATEKAIQAGTATAGQAAAFQFGSDAYVFISQGTDNVGVADQLIKLTGVDLTNVAFDTLTIGSDGNATLA